MKVSTLNIIIRSFIVIICISISACSSKLHVRVFSEHLTDKDLALIESQFKAAKVLYSISTVRVPKSITSNSILYTPSLNSNKRIHEAINILNSSGFDISWTTILRVENHSFTANNMGLYLFSDGYIQKENQTELDQINEYGSVDCGNNLILNEDSTFNITFDIWDEELEDYRVTTVLGFWKEISKNSVTLTANNWKAELNFKKRRSVEPTTDGILNTISLEPITKNVERGFYLIEPASQPDVNCSYNTSIYQ